MSARQISIKRQGALTLRDALGRTVGPNQEASQPGMRRGMLRSHRQHSFQSRLGCQSARALIVQRKIRSEVHVRDRRADQCIDIAGIKRQSPVKEAPRLEWAPGTGQAQAADLTVGRGL
jgi:hypothetical protein